MIKKVLILIIAVFFIYMSLHTFFLKIDYNRIKYGHKPIFSLTISHADDGGSVRYLGLGYKIVSYHYICHEEISGRTTHGYMVGPSVEDGWPLYTFDKLIAPEDLKFVANKE